MSNDSGFDFTVEWHGMDPAVLDTPLAEPEFGSGDPGADEAPAEDETVESPVEESTLVPDESPYTDGDVYEDADSSVKDDLDVTDVLVDDDLDDDFDLPD